MCGAALREPAAAWPVRLLAVLGALTLLLLYVIRGAGSQHDALWHLVRPAAPPAPPASSALLPAGDTSSSLAECAAAALASAQAALPQPLSRAVLLDVSAGGAFDAQAGVLAPLAELLSSGGWHVLLLHAEGAVPRLLAGTSAVSIPASCAAAHGCAAIGVLVASAAGADTLLWLRHAWPPLSAWPRHYAPVAALPALVTPAADASRMLAHFYSPPPADDLRLCVDGVAAPLLQLGLCPAPPAAGARPLSEAVGLLLPAAASDGSGGRAAAAVAAVRSNVLAYRPAFAAALALAAAAHAGRGEAATLGAVLGGLAESGYAAAVLAPGTLCGDAHAAYSPPAGAAADPFAALTAGAPDPRPRALISPELPPAGLRACLLAGCTPGNATAAPPPPPPAAKLAQSLAAALASFAPAVASALEAAAAAWTMPSQLPPPVLPPLAALSPAGDDALALASAPPSCFPSRPWQRDMALAVTFNKPDHAQAPLLARLRALWGPLFPLMAAFADLPDAPRLARFACETGRLSPGGRHSGDDAHTCLARAAPLAFGRVGVLFLMDDALLAPWHAARFDARRIWLPQAHRVEGDFGPSGDVMHGVDASNAHLGDHFVARYAEWYAAGHLPPALARMQAANAAALGRGMQLVRGTTDTVYLPRAVLPHFARLVRTAAGLYQELFLPTLTLAVMRLGDVLPMNIGPRAVPRAPAGTAPDSAEAGDWHPGDHVVHPFKMGSNEAAAELAAARFQAWYALPPNCSAQPAAASGGAVETGGVAARRWPWWHAPAWLAAACVPNADWATLPGTLRMDVRP